MLRRLRNLVGGGPSKSEQKAQMNGQFQSAIAQFEKMSHANQVSQDMAIKMQIQINAYAAADGQDKTSVMKIQLENIQGLLNQNKKQQAMAVPAAPPTAPVVKGSNYANMPPVNGPAPQERRPTVATAKSNSATGPTNGNAYSKMPSITQNNTPVPKASHYAAFLATETSASQEGRSPSTTTARKESAGPTNGNAYSKMLAVTKNTTPVPKASHYAAALATETSATQEGKSAATTVNSRSTADPTKGNAYSKMLAVTKPVAASNGYVAMPSPKTQATPSTPQPAEPARTPTMGGG